MATRKPRESISARREALREEHAEAVREKIQTTQLLKRLQAYALGEKVGKSVVKLSGGELKAIEMLLDKTLPNLASVKHEVEAKQVVFLIDTQVDGNTDNQVSTSG
jgi:hypothetical protein